VIARARASRSGETTSGRAVGVRSRTTMHPGLPLPDPYESPEPMPAVGRLAAPVAVFVRGRPSPEAERLSDAILDFRPGALIVFARH
jgi:hypothetical protein